MSLAQLACVKPSNEDITKCTVYCRDGTLAMIDKVGLCAERSWQRLRGFEWLAKIVSGVNSMTEPKSMT